MLDRAHFHHTAPPPRSHSPPIQDLLRSRLVPYSFWRLSGMRGSAEIFTEYEVAGSRVSTRPDADRAAARRGVTAGAGMMPPARLSRCCGPRLAPNPTAVGAHFGAHDFGKIGPLPLLVDQHDVGLAKRTQTYGTKGASAIVRGA